MKKITKNSVGTSSLHSSMRGTARLDDEVNNNKSIPVTPQPEKGEVEPYKDGSKTHTTALNVIGDKSVQTIRKDQRSDNTRFLEEASQKVDIVN